MKCSNCGFQADDFTDGKGKMVNHEIVETKDGSKYINIKISGGQHYHYNPETRIWTAILADKQ